MPSAGDEDKAMANEGAKESLIEYVVKIINPSRMKEFRNVRVGLGKKCFTVHELREFLVINVPEVNGEKPDFTTVDIGYIEPGHGSKGRKQWINTDEDVEVLFSKHKGKKSILLWAYSRMLKQMGRNQSAVAESASCSVEQKELSGIDKCFEDLKEKHVDGKYTLEQLRMWAHLIQMGKHSSTDEPPDKPFWQGRKRSHSSVKSPVKKVEEQLLSPSKVSLRSELLDQLSKWHKLNESGVITGSEYEELKCTILQDIKQL